MLRTALRVAIVLVVVTAPLGAVPTSPSNLSARVSGDAVTLTWTAPPGVVSAYRVEAGTAPGLSNAANALVGATTSLFVPGVSAGTYYVRIRALAPDGESAPSNEVVVRVGQAQGCAATLTAPTNLTAGVTGSLVALSWVPSPACGAASYVVVGSSPGGSDLAIVHVGGASTFSASAPAGVYYVRVVATSAQGTVASNSATVVARGPLPAGGAPRGLARDDD